MGRTRLPGDLEIVIVQANLHVSQHVGDWLHVLLGHGVRPVPTPLPPVSCVLHAWDMYNTYTTDIYLAYTCLQIGWWSRIRSRRCRHVIMHNRREPGVLETWPRRQSQASWLSWGNLQLRRIANLRSFLGGGESGGSLSDSVLVLRTICKPGRSDPELGFSVCSPVGIGLCEHSIATGAVAVVSTRIARLFRALDTDGFEFDQGQLYYYQGAGPDGLRVAALAAAAALASLKASSISGSCETIDGTVLGWGWSSFTGSDRAWVGTTNSS